MPAPLDEAAQVNDPPLPDLLRKHGAKSVPPKSDGLATDVDSLFGQEVLNVAQRQRVSHVHHHDQTHHFWRTVEISEWVAHGQKLPRPEADRKITVTRPLKARQALRDQFMQLHRKLLSVVRDDAICRRLMTIPGVGPVVSLAFCAAIDIPTRFRNSKASVQS
jgi:hypothetical protein